MDKFNIDYTFNNEDYEEMKNKLRTYAKVGDQIDVYSTFGLISIKFNGKLIPPKLGVKATVSDWVWLVALSMVKTFDRLKDNPRSEIHFLDNPVWMYLEKKGDYIKVDLKGLEKDVIYSVELLYAEFLKSILNFLKKFTSEMLFINPNLGTHTEFKQILKGKEKIRVHLGINEVEK